MHRNSGVLNHIFYTLAEGGTVKNDEHEEYEVRGIGIEKGINIMY